MKKNLLIIAPHCDDEILGCGGIISKNVKMGNLVYVAIVGNGNIGAPELFKAEGTKKVRSEALEAHNLIGVKETFFLDFPAPRLDTVPSYKISLAIEKIIRQYKISDLYLPHRGDIHKDHRIAYEAALVSARPINDNPVRNIFAYETLSETEWAAPFSDDAFIPQFYVDISDTLEDKLNAFRCFETQMKTAPHPRSIDSIKNLAKYRGSNISMDAAEAFMVIRMIK